MPAHKIGRLWKFKVSQVDAWVEAGSADLVVSSAKKQRE